MAVEDEFEPKPTNSAKIREEKNLPMTRMEFMRCLKSIWPDGDSEINTWIICAKELERMDSSNYELPMDSYKTEDVFLRELCQCIEEIHKIHGKEIAAKVISMAQLPFCLYPWEMKHAAIHLADGADIHEIQRLSEDGLLEDFSSTEKE